jgi:hypothetical protein
MRYDEPRLVGQNVCMCVCLLLQDLLQSRSRGGRGIVEDMCYERRAEAYVDLGYCNYVELIDTIFTDVEGVD